MGKLRIADGACTASCRELAALADRDVPPTPTPAGTSPSTAVWDAVLFGTRLKHIRAQILWKAGSGALLPAALPRLGNPHHSE